MVKDKLKDFLYEKSITYLLLMFSSLIYSFWIENGLNEINMVFGVLLILFYVNEAVKLTKFLYPLLRKVN